MKARGVKSDNFVLSVSVLRIGSSQKFCYCVGAFALCALVVTGCPAAAQQSGSTEQVHTGVTSGLDTDARLRNLLADHQFLRLESQLDQLPPDEAEFYRGILANRNNDAKASIQLLEPLVDKVTASGNTEKEKLLRKALAEDYLRLGDLAKAGKAYASLEARMVGHLTQDEQDELELPLKLLPLAAANPPMTVDPYDPFRLQVTKSPLDITELPVYIDARPHSWMLDPTAPFNLIARSLAKEAGLKVSDESVTIHTLTGRPMLVHVAVIPRFTIGGCITFHNVTAFVFEDADYFFPLSHFQVKGVLAYPALSALGSLTITGEDTIEVRPFQPSKIKQESPSAAQGDVSGGAGADDHPFPGARFFLDGDQMIVALGAAGQERMYVVDASSQQSYLTSRYYEEHASDFAGQKMQLLALPGVISAAPQPAYEAETIPLDVGPNTVDVHYIQVLTQPLGSAALDDVYGVLGLDVLDQLRGYTFDYRTMRFSVGPE
jgi:hypothetical protein